VTDPESLHPNPHRSIVVPAALLIGLLVASGMLIRCWAWIEVSIRIWLFNFIMLASGDILGPQLNFTGLQYSFPLTVTLQAPELQEEGRTFLSARRMRLTLERIPAAGRAVEISEVQFVRPVLRVRWNEDGSLLGLNPRFIKSLQGEEYTSSISTNPSDFLSIRLIEVVRGSLHFEPYRSGVVRIDDITMRVDATPREGHPGLYSIDSSVERPPFLGIDLDGSVNIDTGDVLVDNFIAKLQIDPADIGSIPDDVRTIVDEYSIVGDVGLRIDGLVPLVDPIASELMVELMVEQGGAMVSDYRIPIPKLVADLQLHGKRLVMEQLVMQLPRSGSMHMTGDLALESPRDFDLQFDINDLRLETIIAQLQDDHPRYSGSVGMSGEVASRLDDPLGHLSGNGSVHLSHGDILNVPVVQGLQDAVLGRSEWPMGDDEASMLFALEPNRVVIDDFSLEGDHLGVRGEGELYFDSRINFRFNAGPLEKLQMNLGAVGDIFGFITDRLVTYQVTGDWSTPRFSGRVLGLGTEHRSASVAGN
tara:strand:- start:12781 stop:14379 length:1599 start_codon:yes stop_codon:yes gene_type:complete